MPFLRCQRRSGFSLPALVLRSRSWTILLVISSLPTCHRQSVGPAPSLKFREEAQLAVAMGTPTTSVTRSVLCSLCVSTTAKGSGRVCGTRHACFSVRYSMPARRLENVSPQASVATRKPKLCTPLSRTVPVRARGNPIEPWKGGGSGVTRVPDRRLPFGVMEPDDARPRLNVQDSRSRPHLYGPVNRSFTAEDDDEEKENSSPSIPLLVKEKNSNVFLRENPRSIYMY